MIRVHLGVVVALAISAGCGLREECEPADGDETTLVITFDDGPLAADIAPGVTTDPDVLLRSLYQILDTLDRRGVRGVFYVKGPGDGWEDPTVLQSAFAAGIEAIHVDGHLLGYHAYDHTRALWASCCGPSDSARLAMGADLDRLVAFLDSVLMPGGLSRTDVFSPLFRQPYGGLGSDASPAVEVARERGWIYRGFRIDSVDWLRHADAGPFPGDPRLLDDDAACVAFIQRRLRNGVMRNRSCAMHDVLFHVNGVTADHLDQWLDTLSEAVVDLTGHPPAFDVPSSYTGQESLIADATGLLDLVLYGEP